MARKVGATCVERKPAPSSAKGGNAAITVLKRSEPFASIQDGSFYVIGFRVKCEERQDSPGCVVSIGHRSCERSPSPSARPGLVEPVRQPVLVVFEQVDPGPHQGGNRIADHLQVEKPVDGCRQ